MKKLILITTEGCEACNIMRKLVDRAFKYDMVQARSVKYEEKDFKELPKSVALSWNVTDFPTLVFINENYTNDPITNNEVIHKLVGTKTVAEIVSDIMKYL